MHRIFAAVFSFTLALQAAHAANTDAPAESKTNQTISLPVSGTVAYRVPVQNSQGKTVVLLHGVYGGASHRTFNELTPLLDDMGFRVFLVDLPGAGASATPKKSYTREDIATFINEFLEQVSGHAVVIAESVTTAATLQVAAQAPELLEALVLLSPTGINTLSVPPNFADQGFFAGLFSDDEESLSFYQNLLSEQSARFFLELAFFDDSLVTDERIAETRSALSNPDSRWLALSFIGNRIWGSFAELAPAVSVPTLALFGRDAEAIGGGAVETAEEFAAIQPAFTYATLDECGQLVHREKPEITATLIADFAHGLPL